MSFIIFGKFSCNHVYFLCYALCTLFREMMTDVLDDNKISLYFYSMYLAILSRFLAIIPFIINKRLSKSKKAEQNKKVVNSKLIIYIIIYQLMLVKI